MSEPLDLDAGSEDEAQSDDAQLDADLDFEAYLSEQEGEESTEDDQEAAGPSEGATAGDTGNTGNTDGAIDFSTLSEKEWAALMAARSGEVPSEEEQREAFEQAKRDAARKAEEQAFIEFMKEEAEKSRQAAERLNPFLPQEDEAPAERVYGDLTDLTDAEIAQVAKDRIAATLSDAELRARGIDPADVEFQELAPRPEPEYPDTEYSRMSTQEFAAFMKQRDQEREEAR